MAADWGDEFHKPVICCVKKCVLIICCAETTAGQFHRTRAHPGKDKAGALNHLPLLCHRLLHKLQLPRDICHDRSQTPCTHHLLSCPFFVCLFETDISFIFSQKSGPDPFNLKKRCSSLSPLKSLGLLRREGLGMGTGPKAKNGAK